MSKSKPTSVDMPVALQDQAVSVFVNIMLSGESIEVYNYTITLGKSVAESLRLAVINEVAVIAVNKEMNNPVLQSTEMRPAAHIYEEVYCNVQVEGTHNWPDCPFDEVAYLRDPHRHVFHIKAYVAVTHSDRDVEFIMLKHAIQNYLKAAYWDDVTHQHLFGAKSCEMIGKELMNAFDLSRVEVSEDAENGALLLRIPE